MDVILEGLLKGMGAAGWVIGFLALLGAFLIVVGIFGLALSYAMQGPEKKKEDREHDDTDD